MCSRSGCRSSTPVRTRAAGRPPARAPRACACEPRRSPARAHTHARAPSRTRAHGVQRACASALRGEQGERTHARARTHLVAAQRRGRVAGGRCLRRVPHSLAEARPLAARGERCAVRRLARLAHALRHRRVQHRVRVGSAHVLPQRQGAPVRGRGARGGPCGRVRACMRRRAGTRTHTHTRSSHLVHTRAHTRAHTHPPQGPPTSTCGTRRARARRALQRSPPAFRWPRWGVPPPACVLICARPSRRGRVWV